MAGAIAPYCAMFLVTVRLRMAYRMAAWAGFATNLFFLFIHCGVMEAVYRSRTEIAGYGLDHAVTYVTLTQSLLMVAPQWGDVGVSARVRSGQIATDLCRPVNFTLLYFAGQMGSSAFHLVTRAIPIMLVGWMAGYLGARPETTLWAQCALSVLLAAWIAAALLFLLELSSFWLESDRGIRRIFLAITAFFGGLLVPIAYFPDWLRAISRMMPFEHTLNIPSHLFIGIVDASTAWTLVATQAAWALALTIMCHALLKAGTKRLIVAGG